MLRDFYDSPPLWTLVRELVHYIFESLILNGQTYLQRPHVSSHPFAGNGAVEAGVFLDGKFLWEVEDGLFPVCRLDVRASAEHHTQVGEIKENIEISAQAGQLAVSADLQEEAGGEGSVGDTAGVDVEVEDGCGVARPHAVRDDLHAGLLQDGDPHAGHLEAVHVRPELTHVAVVPLRVGDSAELEAAPVREDEAAGGEIFLPGLDHRVQHPLVQQEVAHPLRHDDVELIVRELNVL